jgi:hypothetical protein
MAEDDKIRVSRTTMRKLAKKAEAPTNPKELTEALEKVVKKLKES